ncbi:MAG TPA: hypothetical protein VKD72_20595, partial [Gemmataceae bacterium]|nr:hypothetical protein [Gemmataceae bacterium]
GDGGVQQVLEFQGFVLGRKRDAAGRHFVIIGGDPVSRSELAVSLGCEFISSWMGVYFISAVKLLEDPGRLGRVCRTSPQQRGAVQCLIVDDLNVELPIPRETKEERKSQRAAYARQLASPLEAGAAEGPAAAARQAQRIIDLVDEVERLREEFGHVSTIWVLTGKQPPAGAADPNDRVWKWEAFIEKLLAPTPSQGHLTVIHLQPPAPPEVS